MADDPILSPDPDPPLDPELCKEARKRTYDIIERMELEHDKALLILHPVGISVTSSLLVALSNRFVVRSSCNLPMRSQNRATKRSKTGAIGSPHLNSLFRHCACAQLSPKRHPAKAQILAQLFCN
jgi:hypothetical protein